MALTVLEWTDMALFVGHCQLVRQHVLNSSQPAFSKPE